ncbi:hypothetical protein AV540_25305 [Brevibacillus parabrevis]|uniref:carbamoyltransferase HypF n=1 Tax=Brevibacillus parabrevis TaxID=54914 RepID=UPI0007ABA4EA|nr:carbamoyltransferase HypF [Brevibacillus parabrevis]KZE43344.1 hypothetical protein AV540_25305 [Brevibacillus parabrevis]
MERVKISIHGVVQGVGFRPFIYRIALSYNLSGFTRNQCGEVIIEIEGNKEDIKLFLHDLQTKAEAPAKISSVIVEEMPLTRVSGFKILESKKEGQNNITIPPDLAVCQKCLEDISSLSSRFYSYPFTSCTNCGPRYSIIRSLPYDRNQTAMADFPTCQDCSVDYEDPLNRRYHAQTITCPSCGPQMVFKTKDLEFVSTKWVEHTDNALRNGSILAVKGIGGFHLICDATQAPPILTLRIRKRRARKPFAIMAKDIGTVQRYFELSEIERGALTGRQGLIMLLTPNEDGTRHLPIAELAPGYARLGVMLPYTPMHQLLFGEERSFLVVTSGNRSGHSIARTTEEAQFQLEEIADAIVTHEREICIRVEDSVAQVTDGSLQLLRRSRGYVPESISVPLPPGLAFFPLIIGMGAEWKNAFCLLNANGAVMSQHIGDVSTEEQLEIWRQSVSHLCGVMTESPALVAYDPHPSFLLTEEVQERIKVPITVPVYHHHAHLASCMAEHMLTAPVIGCILDGTGYGPDQTLWGFEILTGDYLGFERALHLEPLRLPGGEAAIQKPWMMAMSLIAHAFDDVHDEWNRVCESLFPSYREWYPLLWSQLTGILPAPAVTSAGRLFDGVSALLRLCMKNTYEGEAAILLGEAAEKHFAQIHTDKTYAFSIEQGELKVKQMLKELITDIWEQVPVGQVAVAFHQTIAEMIAASVMNVSHQTAIQDVVLSGGVWGNRLLQHLTVGRLRQLGLNVYTQQKVPSGDGGIALGQAVVALWRWTQHVSVGASKSTRD